MTMDIPTIFADIEPTPQDDGPEPVCAISYSPEFVEAHDYLRSVVKIDERSERAFDLTTVCLKLNPANYTVWHFRRRCLIALTAASHASDRLRDANLPTIDLASIEKDLDFADRLGGTNPKNYQLWYHRRALLECLLRVSDGNLPGEESSSGIVKIARKELEYVDKILGDDSKNYHAWSHRQWIIRTVNNSDLWVSEVDYSHSKILSDPRNNSAWNQRWFALHEGQISTRSNSSKASYRGKSILSLEKANDEANYALCGAKVDPFNESPWRYLISVLTEQWRFAQNSGDAGEVSIVSALLREYVRKIREMKQFWDEQQSSGNESHGPCVSMMSALVDLLEIFTNDEVFMNEAMILLDDLVEEDPVRRKYWKKRKRAIRDLLRKKNESQK
mmetsp:Transcript_27725/g.58265  ORF Transcript_27725/g.58265 Transcript_27725/m.58265 type:complete len:389 (+) Transcript_27725:192-1358(+)